MILPLVAQSLVDGDCLPQPPLPQSDEGEGASLRAELAEARQCVRVVCSTPTHTWHRIICLTHGWRGPVEDSVMAAERTCCGVAAALAESARFDQFAELVGLHTDQRSGTSTRSASAIAHETAGERSAR